jgi:Secretion system C-terminal sorting domain/Fibronectin type III domain
MLIFAAKILNILLLAKHSLLFNKQIQIYMQFFNKQTIWFCLLFLLPVWAKAQVNAYNFNQLSGTYTAITGGAVVGSTTSDDQRYVDPAVPAGGTAVTGVGLPIGFNFTFNGFVFDRFAINNNGWIVLGQSALTPAVNITSSSSYTAISATTTTAPPQLAHRIAAFSRDLQGQVGSEIRYQTIGTAPNRTLVVQWLGVRRFAATGDILNFQIRLNETTNIVETVYGTWASGTGTVAGQVGLRGTTNADFNNRDVVNATNTWATSTAGALNTATAAYQTTSLPLSGQIYRWIPSTCPPPTGLAATPTTPTAANFSWTNNLTNAQMVIVPQGNGANTGTALPISGTTATNSSLSAATSYSVFIRTICAIGDTSNWSIAVNFTTPCVNLTPPWTESFETVAVATVGGPLPNCWFRNVTDFATGNGVQTQNRSARTGTKYLYTAWSTAAGTGDWAWTPAFDFIAGRQYEFSFWYKVDGLAGFDTLRVGVGNAQTTAAMTIIGSSVLNVTNTGYQQYIINYIAPTTGTYHFGVNVWATFNPWYMTFDDFNVIESPTCPQPNAITFPSLRADSTVIAWNSPAPGNSWYVYYGASGTTPSGVGTLINTNPYTITNLNPNTNYTFYVREFCTAGDTSNWSGPFNFVTDCAPSTVGDSLVTAINVNTVAYNTTGNTARCFTNTIGNTAADVWYRVVLDPCATAITASLCTGTSFDTYLRIYDATGTNQIAFNDDGCGAQSIISNLDVRAYDTVYVLVEGFSTNSGAYTLSINQASVTPTADISYNNTSYCTNGINPIAINAGSVGGIFSTNPSNITLDPVNGEVNLSTAVAGLSYQIIYNVGQPGCSFVDSFQISTTAADNADFNYSLITNEHLCETNSTANPNVTGLSGGSFSTTSPSLSLNTSSGMIDAVNSTAGLHTVYYTTNGTCPNTSSIMVLIDTLEDTSFDYLPTNVCNNVANIMPTLTGLAGGLYTGGMGLFIDSLTGEINIMMSAAGAYTVSYTMPNACASQGTDMLMITPMDNATFSYNTAVYCQNANNPLPIVTGMSGGTFSSGSGLPVDIGTGLIYLSSATADVPQTVIYATNGACANFSVVTVTINSADTADFYYDSLDYCLTISPTLQIPILAGSIGGTFTVLNGGLNINSNTGAFSIDTTISNAGVYTIRRIRSTTNCPDTATVTIELIDCFTTALNELESETQFQLYPNPTSGQFFITVANRTELVDLTVIDMLGRTILTQNNVLLNNQPYAVELNNMPAGTYYIRLSNQQQIKVLPVVLIQP